MNVNKLNEYPKIKLPIVLPIITTYTQHAHLLSIIGSDEEVLPWIFSNYIQLYINKDYHKRSWGDFYFPFPYETRPSDLCKYIITQKIDRRNIDNLVTFIINSITSNNYVHTMFNEYYLSKSPNYHKVNFNHDLLIYGFNLFEEIFYVCDFYKNGKYVCEKLSFSEVCEAYTHYEDADTNDYLTGLVYLYRLNSNCDYKFNINNITNSIKEYLFHTTPEYWMLYNSDNKDDIVFGIEIYDVLKNYLIKQSSIHEICDIRIFYLLYEHKSIMVKRFQYLYDKGLIKSITTNDINELKELENKCKNILYTIIKYKISMNIHTINSVIEMLYSIKNKEYSILIKFV